MDSLRFTNVKIAKVPLLQRMCVGSYYTHRQAGMIVTAWLAGASQCVETDMVCVDTGDTSVCGVAAGG
jgi:hypothetical protein